VSAATGARSVLHTANILRLSEDLPVVIEIVETSEHVARLTPILDEMVREGLVTMEKVQVLKYAAARARRPDRAPARRAVHAVLLAGLRRC
jgi:PII-like signaling protein